MSGFKNFVEGEVSEDERQIELQLMLNKAIRARRVRDILESTIRGVEEKDRMCQAVIMSAEDWGVLRKWAGENLDIDVNPAALRSGIMGQYLGITIMVQIGFSKMVGVPVVGEAENCLMVLLEEDE